MSSNVYTPYSTEGLLVQCISEIGVIKYRAVVKDNICI